MTDPEVVQILVVVSSLAHKTATARCVSGLLHEKPAIDAVWRTVTEGALSRRVLNQVLLAGAD